MEGFWTNKEIESRTRPDGKSVSCISCGLSKDCKSPKMQPFGNFKKKILNIGEAPGEVEDRRGKPFQGKTGQLLQRTYEKLGVNLFEDCLNLNAVNCRPIDNDNNRAPTNYEMDCCRRIVLQTIDKYKPKVIILLGNAAVYSLIGHRWKKDLGGITKWRGWAIPDQDILAWLCPTFHPSYVERSDNGPEQTVWIQDLKQAFAMLNQPFLKHVEPRVDIIEDLYMLNNITNVEVAFDYETTGIKPHGEGHRIVCCAVAPSENHAYVFMMPKTREERKPFINLLLEKRIGKIAQNMKFEHAWSLVRLKTEVQNWVWDTMLASHILDNRPGITSLQFQVYVQFGVIDYKDETEPYLKAVDNNSANSMNRIMDLVNKPGGKEMLMKRCALDAVYEFRLAEMQRQNILPF